MLDFETILNRYRMTHSPGDHELSGLKRNRLYGLNDLIKENLNSNSLVCELGSHVGSSSALFAYYCKLVYCVDVWTTIKEDYIPEFEGEFDAYVADFPNIIKIKNTSVDASFRFTDYFFDLVYIDASHDYKDVVDDIKYWKPKVKKGGFLAGHDYLPLIPDNDVSKAVKELLGEPDKTYADSSWLKRIND